MSSGEKQKIAVASVNAVDPEIYVFDEPSANLDMYSVEALKNLMRKLKEEVTQSLSRTQALLSYWPCRSLPLHGKREHKSRVDT